MMMPRSLAPIFLCASALAFAGFGCSPDDPPGQPGVDAGGDLIDTGRIPTIDEDMDGIDDTWERDNGLDPTRNDAGEDPDVDGISNLNEYLGGTDPFDIDSDDDGLGDGEEDANKNGMIDAGETNPAEQDSDGDGLTDGQEAGRATGLSSPRAGVAGTDAGRFVPDRNPATTTDPTNPDTDGDGIPDGVEDANRDGALDVTETNPLDLDSDDDGIADGTEDANHDGIVDATETDPRNHDTDGDGIWDGVESGVTMPIADPDGENGPLLGTREGAWRADADPTTTTDPLNPDTDGDGVSDGDEDWNYNGRYEPPAELNPNVADSDGDGIPDAQEGIAVVCSEGALRPVTLHAIASADVSVALTPNFSEVSVLRDADGVGVAIMFRDPTSGVVGVAISKTPSGADVGQEKQLNRDVIDAEVNLSNEQDRALITWDGFDGVFTTATGNRGGRSGVTIATDIAQNLAGAGALMGALPDDGNNPGVFTVYFETILRTTDRAIVLAAIAAAPTADAELIALADLANGTGIAQFGDFTGIGCDPFETPPGANNLDFLWVVDNSCSMEDEQDAVAAVGQEMVNLLSTTQLSWRLALTTTDRADGSIINSGVNGFTVSTPRAQAEAESQAWASAVGALGTGGSGEERGLVVGHTAASAALANVSATESNIGFREDAAVIVVHMSDEEDFSVKEAAGGNDASCPENAGKQASIDALTSQYQTLAQNPSIDGMTTFAIHGIQPNATGADYCDFNSGSSDCNGESQHGRSYIDVAAGTGGGTGSICGDMGQIVQDIVRAGAGIASKIELTQPPISSTIRVVIADESGSFVGQPDVPRSRINGFDYAFEIDPMSGGALHKIIFYGQARPPGERELIVSYRAWIDGSPHPGGPVDNCPDGQIPNPDTGECEVDPECDEGCPDGQICNPNTGLCEEDCNEMCVEGEICLDGVCVEDDPCDGMCAANQICDDSTDPPTCRDIL